MTTKPDPNELFSSLSKKADLAGMRLVLTVPMNTDKYRVVLKDHNKQYTWFDTDFGELMIRVGADMELLLESGD